MLVRMALPPQAFCDRMRPKTKAAMLTDLYLDIAVRRRPPLVVPVCQGRLRKLASCSGIEPLQIDGRDTIWTLGLV